MQHITPHSLDRYKKARAIISEGAGVAAACKKARIAVGHFYQIRKTLKQRRQRTNGRVPFPLSPPLKRAPTPTDTAIAQLEKRRDETDTAIRVLKSL